MNSEHQKRSHGDRLLALRQRREQLEARIGRLEAREKAFRRKDDTRRKVIVGALALTHLERNPGSDFASLIGRLLDEYVRRPRDRALFEFLPETVTEEGQDDGRDSGTIRARTPTS